MDLSLGRPEFREEDPDAAVVRFGGSGSPRPGWR